jgi:hypothetical protein
MSELDNQFETVIAKAIKDFNMHQFVDVDLSNTEDVNRLANAIACELNTIGIKPKETP